MQNIIVVSQKPSDLGELIAIARRLGEPLILAFQESAVSINEITGYGHKVYRLNSDRPEALYYAIKSLYDSLKPKLIIGPTTKNVKDALSLFAGLYDIPLATDVSSIEDRGDEVIYKRGFLSERVIMTASVRKPAILLVKPKIVSPAEKIGKSDVIDLEVTAGDVKLLERKPKVLSGIKLEDADIVVGVGRGFKSREDLKLALELANLLGGQVGGTRPIAADYKWLPEDAWIGISGKRIAPKLYIAIGISGAPQHMSGVSDSKIIVAINKDKSAPIFKLSDYGIVNDLYKVLPILISRLKARASQK
ncbi:MAG: electron transfer flavoprotein subunit alpha/FixB family protein [Acidilobaceae archaeon]